MKENLFVDGVTLKRYSWLGNEVAFFVAKDMPAKGGHLNIKGKKALI